MGGSAKVTTNFHSSDFFEPTNITIYRWCTTLNNRVPRKAALCPTANTMKYRTNRLKIFVASEMIGLDLQALVVCILVNSIGEKKSATETRSFKVEKVVASGHYVRRGSGQLISGRLRVACCLPTILTNFTNNANATYKYLFLTPPAPSPFKTGRVHHRAAYPNGLLRALFIVGCVLPDGLRVLLPHVPDGPQDLLRGERPTWHWSSASKHLRDLNHQIPTALHQQVRSAWFDDRK